MEKITITKKNFKEIENKIKTFSAGKSWALLKFTDTSFETVNEILNCNGKKPKGITEHYEYSGVLQIDFEVTSYNLAGIPFINLTFHGKRIFCISGEEDIYFFHDKRRIVIDALKDVSILTGLCKRVIIVITDEIK